jgi:putative membrane protein
VVGVLAEIGYPLAHGGARAVLTGAAVLACCAAVLTHAASTRGWRTAVAAAAVFGAGGWLVEAVGVNTGVPFGAYRYGTALGPAVAGVPLLVGLAWCMTAWPAYLAARRLSVRWAVPLAAAALASWDLFLDPQMVAAGYWSWRHPTPALPGLPGVPLTNYAGWLLTATILMAAFERAAGRSARTSRPVGADAVPLALYLWTYGSSVLAHAAFLGLPGSALWGGAGMGLIAVPLAVRLARR